MSLAENKKAVRETAIIQSATDFVIIATDRRGRVTEWNTGAERILGWSAEEMQGQTAERFFTPEDRAAGVIEQEMTGALEDGRAADNRWHLRKDGKRFFASGEMTPLRSEEGDHLGYLKILRDQTAAQNEADALRKAQDRLAESEAFLQRVLASSADCIKVLDHDGRLTFMSEGGMQVMEVSDFNAIRGCPWPNFWEGNGHEGAKAAVAAAREGRTSTFVAPANTFLGTPKWWDVQVTSIPDAHGRPDKILSVSRDITDRRKAEEELRVLNSVLEQRVKEQTADRNALWQLSRDLMLRCSFEGIMTAVNPAWAEILGWSEGELLGTNLFDLIHPDDFVHTIEGARELSEGQGHTRFENRYRCKDGQYRWVSWTTRSGDGMINAIGRDVTEDRLKAEALHRAEEALRQSQKMEAVGQLTGGIAHDFNNLLAVITGSLELLALRLGQGRVTEIDKFVTAAQTATKRASSLTHRLLAFSRRQTLDPRFTGVNEIVTDMRDLIDRTAGPTIAVETVLAPDLWTTLVDPNQLENALLNLCINAKDAMPDGGRLTIETSNQNLTSAIADMRDMVPGEYIALSVSDTGTGMAPEVIARAFEPFYTTKPTGQGTGLGLSMIYGFARQSDGQVRIHSEVGRGTTVAIYLPRSEGDVNANSDQSESVAPSRAERGQTVLVVDDEANIRMLIVDVLEELGYSAIEAQDGPAALKVLQSHMRIDLLVTDVGMPGGMNGRQLADAGRQVRPGLKTLFITGYAETAVVSHDQLDKGMAVIVKPFAMDVLANRIKEMISAE